MRFTAVAPGFQSQGTGLDCFTSWYLFLSVVDKLAVSKVAAAAAAAAKSLQLCLTLCNLIDSSPPGSPIPGILQARTLRWVAISFSNA